MNRVAQCRRVCLLRKTRSSGKRQAAGGLCKEGSSCRKSEPCVTLPPVPPCVSPLLLLPCGWCFFDTAVFLTVWRLCKSCVFTSDDEHILLSYTCFFCLLVGLMKRFPCCQRLCGISSCCLTHVWFPLVFEIFCRIVWVYTGAELYPPPLIKGMGGRCLLLSGPFTFWSLAAVVTLLYCFFSFAVVFGKF